MIQHERLPRWATPYTAIVSSSNRTFHKRAFVLLLKLTVCNRSYKGHKQTRTKTYVLYTMPPSICLKNINVIVKLSCSFGLWIFLCKFFFHIADLSINETISKCLLKCSCSVNWDYAINNSYCLSCVFVVVCRGMKQCFDWILSTCNFHFNGYNVYLFSRWHTIFI